MYVCERGAWCVLMCNWVCERVKSERGGVQCACVAAIFICACVCVYVCGLKRGVHMYTVHYICIHSSL